MMMDLHLVSGHPDKAIEVFNGKDIIKLNTIFANINKKKKQIKDL
jgi:hypothetical protein